MDGGARQVSRADMTSVLGPIAAGLKPRTRFRGLGIKAVKSQRPQTNFTASTATCS
jgi:hypothetical protein